MCICRCRRQALCIRIFRLQSCGYLDVQEASSYLVVLESSTGCHEVEKASRAISGGVL